MEPGGASPGAPTPGHRCPPTGLTPGAAFLPTSPSPSLHKRQTHVAGGTSGSGPPAARGPSSSQAPGPAVMCSDSPSCHNPFWEGGHQLVILKTQRPSCPVRSSEPPETHSGLWCPFPPRRQDFLEAADPASWRGKREEALGSIWNIPMLPETRMPTEREPRAGLMGTDSSSTLAGVTI